MLPKYYFATFFLLLLSTCSFGHSDGYLEFKNVTINQNQNHLKVDFTIVNLKNKAWENIEIELIGNGEITHRQKIERWSCDEKSKTFSWDVLLTSNEIIDVNLAITSAFGLNHTIASWTNNIEKQANTIASEFYADAPHRMLKFNSQGNENGIPVHFFLHDANAVGFNVNVDNINLQIKNAVDLNYGPVLTYNTIPTFNFFSQFSNQSQIDNTQSIQEFNLFSMISSPIKTIDFIINSDAFGNFISVNKKFWYFTFTIPPSDLVGMNDVIDIKVTIQYSNLTFADEVIILRVNRAEENLPSIPYFYRGDTHLHSMYTNNDAEIGLPLKATKVAASLAGLDWITTTDHTSDYDNYGAGVNANWTRINQEIIALNSEDSSFLYIPGLEVAVKNSDSKLVHMLAYPNPLQPHSMPFIGDGNGDLIPTSTTAASALADVDNYNGFAYMAHPLATGDALPTIPVNGGIWNLSNPNFPANGNTFPKDGGNIISNNLTKSSDFLGDLTIRFLKNGLAGAQIWNSRYSLKASGDSNNPWSGSGSFTPADTAGIEHHIRRFRQGQEMVNFVNLSAMKAKNTNPALENWKMYYSAGSDAHGSFNYSNTNDFLSLGSISNSAVGDIVTAVYCPNGMGSDGQHVLTALKNGNSTLSDGPLLAIGLSTDGMNTTNEVFMGQDIILDGFELPVTYLNLDIAITPEFGGITNLVLFLGSDSVEYSDTIILNNSISSQLVQFKLSDWLDSVIGIGNFPEDTYAYIRGELQTRRFFDAQEQVERMITHETYHSFTNPIWFKQRNNVGVTTIENDNISIYPNPTNSSLHVKWEGVSSFNITVFDQLGRQILSTESNSQIAVLDLKDQSSGSYILELKSGNRKAKMSFVKTN